MKSKDSTNVKDEELTARLTIMIKPQELKELKLLALMNDLSMSDLVRMGIDKVKKELNDKSS